MSPLSCYKLFDSHLHIIDKRFPLVPNQGYLPDNFATDDYLQRTRDYNLQGGVVVSGSFQAFDQSYLLSALKELGSNFVGVTQLPSEVSDDVLVALDEAGVRAVRFNIKRGGSETAEHLEHFARRLYETVGWHVELYVDSRDLAELSDELVSLPAVCIDHLGLSGAGLPDLLSLVEKGVYVKATGFGRVDIDVRSALKAIAGVNPQALLFGTDLPSTRARRPYVDDDFLLVVDALGEKLAQRVFYDNAVSLYRPRGLFRHLL